MLHLTLTNRQIAGDKTTRTVEAALVGMYVGLTVTDARPGGCTVSRHGALLKPGQPQTVAALMRPDAVRELLDYLLELDHPDQRFRADLELAISEYLSL